MVAIIIVIVNKLCCLRLKSGIMKHRVKKHIFVTSDFSMHDILGKHCHLLYSNRSHDLSTISIDLAMSCSLPPRLH